MGRNITNASSPSSCECQTTPTEQCVVASQDQRIVYLAGPVSELMITSVIAQILSLSEQSNDPISLVISTYGGSCHEMFSLYDIIKAVNCPIYTVGLGKIMSAGVLLLAAGEKSKRLIGPSARVMLHSMSSGMEGNIFELENELTETKYLQRFLIDSLVRETNMSKDQLNTFMKNKSNVYLSALETIKLGIADKMIGDTKKH